MAADKEFQKGVGEFDSAGELSYIRMENSLLRAFDSIPAVEIPATDSKRVTPEVSATAPARFLGC